MVELAVIVLVTIVEPTRDEKPMVTAFTVEPVRVEATVSVFTPMVEPAELLNPRDCVVRVEPIRDVVAIEEPTRLEKLRLAIVIVDPVRVLKVTLFSPRLFVQSCLPFVLVVKT
jgi:hypothetical protein